MLRNLESEDDFHSYVVWELGAWRGIISKEV